MRMVLLNEWQPTPKWKWKEFGYYFTLIFSIKTITSVDFRFFFSG